MSARAQLKPYSLRLPPAVIEQADAACAKSAALSRNTLLLLAIERGIPIVEQALSLTPPTPASPAAVQPADEPPAAAA